MLQDMLKDKVALITGGGRGIGEACGRILSDYGAKVILADLDPVTAQAVADDLNARGRQAAALEFNVADFPNIRSKVARPGIFSAASTFW